MVTAPAAVLAADELDIDWEQVCVDCASRIVRYAEPIKIVCVSLITTTIRNVRKCAGPSSDMFISLVAYLVPLVLEFFLSQLADYADCEVPSAPAADDEEEDHTTRREPRVSQADLWQAQQQQSRWDNHDRKEDAVVDSWSLNDGQDDPSEISDEDVAAGRHPF